LENTAFSRARKTTSVLLAASFMCLGGCSQTQPMVDKTAAGLALGSVGGGLIASRIPGAGVAGTLLGAAAGGAVGAAIGAALDEQDRQEMARLTQVSFETGQDQEFASPRTGARVSVKVVKTVTVAQKTCRTAQQDVELNDGSKSSNSVTACKGPNGWVI
jgi:surface antigen